MRILVDLFLHAQDLLAVDGVIQMLHMHFKRFFISFFHTIEGCQLCFNIRLFLSDVKNMALGIVQSAHGLCSLLVILQHTGFVLATQLEPKLPKIAALKLSHVKVLALAAHLCILLHLLRVLCFFLQRRQPFFQLLFVFIDSADLA